MTDTRMQRGRALYLAVYETEGAIWEANKCKDLWCKKADRYLELAAPQALAATPAVGGDYVLMPREATRAMTMAGCDSLPSCDHVFGRAGEMLRNAYRRMVEVASQATPAVGGERLPLADHDEIGRKILGQPWAIQSAIVTIAAHCRVLIDKHPTGDVADLAGCISQDCLELANAIAALPASPLRGRDALLRDALQQVYDFMLEDHKSGDSALWTEPYAELFDVVDAALSASPPAQPAAETVLEQSERLDGTIMQTVRLADGSEIVREQPARETCIECGTCEPCDDDCPNYQEPELPAARPMGQS